MNVNILYYMGFVDWLTGKIAAASELNVLKNSFRDFGITNE